MSEYDEILDDQGAIDTPAEVIEQMEAESWEETPPEPPSEPPKAGLPTLMRASDLEEEPPEPAELGFEPLGRYRGQDVVDVEPQDARHAYLFDPKTAPTKRVRAFYVRSKQGTFGLVPWPGSTIIWPWEKAWEQDLYHEKKTPAKKAAMAAFVKTHKGKK